MKARTLLPCFIALAGCHKDEAAAKYDAAKPDDIAVSKPAERTVTDGKELTADGVSLTFPKDWVTIDLTKGQIEGAMKGMNAGPNGPAMAKMLEAAARSGMVKMFAFDPKSSKPGFVNNANLVVTPAGNATLDQALDGSKQQIASMGATAETSKVTLANGEFGKVESRMKAPNGVSYTALGYVKLEGGKLYVVTFSCPNDQAKDYDAKARSVMSTFRL